MMLASTTLNHVTPTQIAAVADAADPDTHAHLDDGWTPPPIGKLDHFVLVPDPAAQAPSEYARLNAAITLLNGMARPARRELAAVMAIGMLGGSTETMAATVRAFRDGRAGCAEVDYLVGKTPLSEYLRRGLAALGLR
ncbi:DUF3775 domain-containing protein [Alienimonas californiensis]|uniref:Uncharacterized protein n=1 Tax=Alienimonas californiensis TaxID=2527989 RepID=A0A517PCS7_9PLAN|nr:DUF3775 domain-containing protein [Alienimonas californiensis]QDT17188.1 hypothetical protein CA12_33000 [Alienimonas californiensis]